MNYEPTFIPVVDGRYVMPPAPEIDDEVAEAFIADMRERVERFLADGAPGATPEQVAMLREGIDFGDMLDAGLGEEPPTDLAAWAAQRNAPIERN